MRRYFTVPAAVCLALLITATAALAAGDWEAARAAFKKSDYATTVRILKKLAGQGLAKAQTQLGYMYVHGLGVTRDFTEAVKWYRRAAKQGDTFGQYNLGRCYDSGRGVPKDYTQAAKWYRLAADKGHPRAQYNLAVCYIRGDGVPKDFVQAYKWIILAAAQKHRLAVRAKPLLAKRMTPAQIARAERLAAKFKPKKSR
jgi:TPR repeat protein